MIPFAIRNLKVYLRDRMSIFFSMLGVIVIIAIYLLFLGDVWVQDFGGAPGARNVMDAWIMAGILGITSLTTSLAAYEAMITDRVKKINKDFISSPISRTSLLGGYILSGIAVGLLMSLLTLAVAEIFIFAKGGDLLTPLRFLKVLVLIVLTTVANSSIVIFLVSLFQSTAAFATASTLIGTLIGFFTGIYLPIGMMPPAVQWIIKLFPVSHAASLFRQVMMEKPLAVTFAGAPGTLEREFRLQLGVNFEFNGVLLPAWASIAILIGTTVVFYALALWVLTRKQK